MDERQFEALLDLVTAELTKEAQAKPFDSAESLEIRVRDLLLGFGIPPTSIDYTEKSQAFPDIAVEQFGVEVKHTKSDSWRSVANSVHETSRRPEVTQIYIVFGKMGGDPGVRWGRYDDCVVHVRTSHRPRFEVEIDAEESLFAKFGITYKEFTALSEDDKMEYIRAYARSRLRPGEHLWWLEEREEPEHAVEVGVKLYTNLSDVEKRRLRAEAALLSPELVQSGRRRGKYNKVSMYLITYHGVLAPQVRDMYTAGSVANPENDDEGGLYLARSLKDIEAEMLDAAARLDDALFVEYWGVSVPPDQRIARWLDLADKLATNWVPSQELFTDR